MTVSPCKWHDPAKSWTSHCKSSEVHCPFPPAPGKVRPQPCGCEDARGSGTLETGRLAACFGAQSRWLLTPQKTQMWVLFSPKMAHPHPTECTERLHCSISALKAALWRTDVIWKSPTPGCKKVELHPLRLPAALLLF